MAAKRVHARFSDCARLEDLPNIGASVARLLRAAGVTTPHALRERDPYRLYAMVNRRSGTRQDPCLLDTFIALARFARGEPARPWWSYTEERKKTLAATGDARLQRESGARGSRPSPTTSPRVRTQLARRRADRAHAAVCSHSTARIQRRGVAMRCMP